MNILFFFAMQTILISLSLSPNEENARLRRSNQALLKALQAIATGENHETAVGAFELPALPYTKDALEPFMSAETLDFHHGKHHNTFVVKLMDLIPGTEFETMSLEEIIRTSTGAVSEYANAVWTHTFFWQCLAPNAGGEPQFDIAEAIDEAFGSFEEFKQKFTDTALNVFGSGYVWLVKEANGQLEIVKTGAGESPLMNDGVTPLLVIDMWEHAYYIDYRNVRGDYLNAFWALVNWQFVAENLAS